jgi:hypothetical protein
MRVLGLAMALTAGGLLAATAHAAGPGVLQFDESSFEVIEEAGVAVVAVERSHGEDGSVSVSYSATAGTATAGLDFTPVSGTLSWPAGDETVRTFEVPIADDSAAEGQETITLALSSATGGATIDSARGTSTVIVLASDGGSGGGGGGGDDGGGDDGGGDDGGGDDSGPGSLKFDERDFYVLEGAAVAVISVERSHGETGAVSVAYRTANGSATTGSDYMAASGVLSWASGDGATRTFTVAIRSDDVGEPVEDVALTLFNPTGGATVDAERSTASLHIRDDDSGAPPGSDDDPGVLKFDESSFVGKEGGSALVRVERSRGERGTVTVRYSTGDGSARAGADYTTVSGSLTWAPGDGSS